MIRPMSKDRSPMYDGTQTELDKALRHGSAQLRVVRAAKALHRAEGVPALWLRHSDKLFANLMQAVAALEALEER